jgi:hypothetical protein
MLKYADLKKPPQLTQLSSFILIPCVHHETLGLSAYLVTQANERPSSQTLSVFTADYKRILKDFTLAAKHDGFDGHDAHNPLARTSHMTLVTRAQEVGVSHVTERGGRVFGTEQRPPPMWYLVAVPCSLYSSTIVSSLYTVPRDVQTERHTASVGPWVCPYWLCHPLIGPHILIC